MEYRREILFGAGLAGTGYVVYQHVKYTPKESLIVAATANMRRRAGIAILQLADRLRSPLNEGVRRTVQRNLVKVKVGVPPQHSHALSATERNTATTSMVACINSLGLKPYVISGSPRESDLDGSRTHHTLADLQQRIREDPLTDRHVIMMTDVDYYVDMHWLLSFGRPVLMYTFQPEVVGGLVNEGYFVINSKSEVHYRVTGGKDVTHPIWDYNQDTVYTQYCEGWQKYLWWLLEVIGLFDGVNCVASHIDQFELSRHRRIVAITPFSTVPVYYRGLTGIKLQRANYDLGGGFVGLKHIGKLKDGGPQVSVSIARAEELNSATLPLLLFEAARTMHLVEPTKHLSDTIRRTQLEPSTAAVIHHYFLSAVREPEVVVHQPGSFGRHYQSIDARDKPGLENGKPYARRYAAPALSQEAVFPTDVPQNASASIRGRITKPQEEARKRQRLVSRFYQYANEFVELLVPEPGIGEPISVQEVDDRQDKERQRIRSAQVRMVADDQMMVRAFPKKEAYAAPNDPRNISGVPTVHTLQLSRFTLAFKEDVLKKRKWYMPAKTPRQIAARVMEVADHTEDVRMKDLSRMDGTELEFQTLYVQDAAYLRWAKTRYHAELRKRLTDEHRPNARTRYGKYDPGWSKLSGSPTTTDGNTMKAASAEYMCLREDGKTKEEAWNILEECYALQGDDSIDGSDVPDETVKRTFGWLGFDLKFVGHASPGEPVDFLGRKFIDPWTTPASMQSPKRTLLKLHTTTNSTLEPHIIGRLKTDSYLVTDGKTPLISNWCRCYQRNVHTTNDEVSVPLEDIPFFARRQEDLAEPWPQDEGIGVEVVADDLGVSCGAVTDMMQQLDDYIGDVANMPQLTVEHDKAKLASLVDGVIHGVGSMQGTNSASLLDIKTTSQNDNGTTAANHPVDDRKDAKDRAGQKGAASSCQELRANKPGGGKGQESSRRSNNTDWQRDEQGRQITQRVGNKSDFRQNDRRSHKPNRGPGSDGSRDQPGCGGRGFRVNKRDGPRPNLPSTSQNNARVKDSAKEKADG